MSRVFSFFLLVFFPFQTIFSQSIELSGKVASSTNVENIHIINKTQQLFTITDRDGLFTIIVRLHDTLAFSSIQHQSKNIIISKQMILDKVVYVKLEEQINELDEIIIGKVLTGNLISDINNTEGDPPINFFDVGIPGYQGKPATQSERRLHEAGEFKPKMLLGLLGGGVPLNPILNGISGRTKMLKKRVEIETKETLMQSIKARLSKDFLVSNPLEDHLVGDFFYFCADDVNFLKHCENQTDFKVLIFLRMKYRQYIENLELSED